MKILNERNEMENHVMDRNNGMEPVALGFVINILNLTVSTCCDIICRFQPLLQKSYPLMLISDNFNISFPL